MPQTNNHTSKWHGVGHKRKMAIKKALRDQMSKRGRILAEDWTKWNRNLAAAIRRGEI